MKSVLTTHLDVRTSPCNLTGTVFGSPLRLRVAPIAWRAETCHEEYRNRMSAPNARTRGTGGFGATPDGR